MDTFLDHMIFVCFSGAAIGFMFILLEGIFKVINYLTKGKFEDWVLNLFEE
jgi:hypothetical protein